MVQTDLSILTALLCGAKERKSPPHLSGQEKCLNPYLVYRVALPILADQDICVLADGAVSLPAQAKKMKQFC